MSFWNVLWLLLVSFFFISYLIVLFNVVVDVFADRGTSGLTKAIWILFLIFVPALTALAYLLFRGDGMAQRRSMRELRAQEAAEAYLRSVAATSPVDQIATARQLLADGAITDAEFGMLKAKALA